MNRATPLHAPPRADSSSGGVPRRALFAWGALLLALLAIAVWDVETREAKSFTGSNASAATATSASTLCAGEGFEARMCEVARDGFAVALDY